MSGESVEVVRQRISVRPTKRRRLEQRLFLRFPSVAAVVVRAVLRLPPSSGLRRVMIRHALRLAVEAANRGDHEAAFVIVPPDYETTTPPELVGLGFEPIYRGREGRLRFQLDWIAEIGDFQNEPEEILDSGDRLLLLGQMKGRGISSGAGFDSEVAYLITISAGRLTGEQDFRSHAEALEAAGLSE